MKNYYFLLLLLIGAQISKAQIANSNFETPGTPALIDASNTVQDWFKVSGTPLVTNEIPAKSGSHVARLSMNNFVQDAFATNYEMQNGFTYQVTAWVFNPTCVQASLIFDAMEYIDANGNTGGSSTQMHHKQVDPDGVWEQVSFTFAPDRCYRQLKLSIIGKGTCERTLYVDNVNVTCLGGVNKVNNGDFSDFSLGTLGGTNAISDGNVTAWASSHGTPDLFDPSGNPHAFMWSHTGWGEGIRSTVNFQQGHTYNVSFRVKTNSVAPYSATWYVKAASGISVPSYNGINMPNVQSQQTITSGPISGAYANWTTVTLQYTPTQNFSQIWIYPYKSLDGAIGGQAELFIDDVMVWEECVITSKCPPISIDFEPLGLLGKEDLEESELALEEEIVVYPNPTQGQMTIRFGEVLGRNTQAKVLDLQGREIVTFMIPGGVDVYEVQLPSAITGGVYQVVLEGKTERLPLVIDK